VPRWVETRWLLLSGEGVLRTAGDGGLVIGRRVPLGAVIGDLDSTLVGDVLSDSPAAFELIVQMEALDRAREALPGWTVALGTIHAPSRSFSASEQPEPGVIVSVAPHPAQLEQLPDEIRFYAERARDIAFRMLDERVVAVCEAGTRTETLWDVGIDTLEGHRRRGHASACFRALAAHMAAQGLQPVWGAGDDNIASMRLAATLGFKPVDRLAVLSPPR
jgi:GNAT superfamily N-acetyltransferase